MHTDYYKIERDKDGFATAQCLDEIYDNLPVVLVRRVDKWGDIELEYCDRETWLDYQGEIDRKVDYAGYFPAPYILM